MDARLAAQLAAHFDDCELGARHCPDCRSHLDVDIRSALTIARAEYERISQWLGEYPDVCIYCGEDSESRDHLVPMPWTGPIIRKYVPVVPCCLDCNERINDAPLFTIAERCRVVSTSLRRTFIKLLSAPAHDDEWYEDFGYKMQVALRAKEAQRNVLRRRLAMLDMEGACAQEF